MTRPSSMVEAISAIVRLLLEVEAGTRPVRHLRPFLAPELQVRTGLLRRRGPTPAVRRVLVQVDGDRAEAVVLLVGGGRTTALVLGLRRSERGWVVTALGRPGDAAPPPPPDADDHGPTIALAWYRGSAAGRAAAASVPAAAACTWQQPAGWRRPVRAA